MDIVEACQTNNITLLKALLIKKSSSKLTPDIVTKIWDNIKSVDAINELLFYNIKPNEKVLIWAACNDNIEIFKKVIKVVPPSDKIWFYVLQNKIEDIILLEILVNNCNEISNKILIFACNCYNIQAINLFLSTKKYKLCEDVFYAACSIGNLQIIDLLIKKQCPMNTKSLLIACSKKNYDLVKILVLC